jgi:hypothetical protein
MGIDTSEAGQGRSLFDWANKECTVCRKPMVKECTPYGGGWRLDCACHDEQPNDSTARQMNQAERDAMNRAADRSVVVIDEGFEDQTFGKS